MKINVVGAAMDSESFDLNAVSGNPIGNLDLAPARQTIALAWIAARNARDRVFDSPLFHNPAWDILLDVYVHRAGSEKTCVNHVCAASSSPATTVLRWIGVLAAEGLIERYRDPMDRRRTILSLSAQGFSKMEAALDAASESDKRLGLGRLRLV